MVILVHSHAPYTLGTFLSYLLSAYMFISGFLFKDEDFLKKLKKIILNLWIPFLFLSTLGYILYYFIGKAINQNNNVFSTFSNFIIFGYVPMTIPVNVIPLWYIYMFIIAELIFLIFHKLKLIHLIPILSILSTMLIHAQTHFFKIDTAFHGLLWFYLGHILKKKGFSYKIKRPLFIFLISTLTLSIIAKFNGFNDWRDNNYGKYPILSYFGEGMFVLISISISNLIKNEKIKEFFEIFGKHTIFVLGYHIVIPGLLAPLVKKPMLFLEKYWWIVYNFTIFILFILLKFLPKNTIYFLSGQFNLIRKYLPKNEKSLPA